MPQIDLIKELIPEGQDRKINLKKTSIKGFWGFVPVVLLIGMGLLMSRGIKKSQYIYTQASSGAILSMAPEKQVVEVGEIFTVNLLLDPKDSLITDAYINIDFPEANLELMDPGKTRHVIHFDQVPTQVQVLTPVRFRAIHPGAKVVLNYSSTSRLESPNQDNQLKASYGTQIEIK
jgi:hypothetical protein